MSNGAALLIAGGGGFANDHFNNRTKSWFFSDLGSALWTPTDLIPDVGSVSLLFRTLDNDSGTGRMFLFFQSDTKSNNGFGLFFENSTNHDPNALKLMTGDKTLTVLPAPQLLAGNWYYFAATFSNPTGQAKWILGALGGMPRQGATNFSGVIGTNGPFYIGNNNTFNNGFRNPYNSGRIDEFAVWNRILSTNEMADQFNALSKLAIERVGTNVVLSWSTTNINTHLESSNHLSSNSVWCLVPDSQRKGSQFLVLTNPIARVN